MYTAATAPGSPVTGSLWYSTTTKKAYVYSGTDWLTFAEDFSATGGTETTYTGYKVHSFLASGNFVVAGADKSMDFMVVAGGGGGGAGQGGGGGGGGMRVFSSVMIPVGTHAVTVGNGGGNGTNGDLNIQGQTGMSSTYSSGGSSQFGNGGWNTWTGQYTGGDATGYGGGGGGGTNTPGGDGSQGVIIVTEYK